MGFNKVNVNVLKFDSVKDIDKIQFNHHILRKENLNRIQKKLPCGQFTISVTSIMNELNISRSKSQRLIKDFEKLGIIKNIKKGKMKKSFSVYQYITNDMDNDIVSDTVLFRFSKGGSHSGDIVNDTESDTLEKDNIKINKKIGTNDVDEWEIDFKY